VPQVQRRDLAVPSRIKAIAMMEPVLASVPTWEDFPADFVDAFRGFRTAEVGWDMLVNQNMFIEGVLPAGIVRDLTEEEMNAYREPFLDPADRKPVWRWPNELPIAGEIGEGIAEWYARECQP
jgi:haloalkane dehalogenase